MRDSYVTATAIIGILIFLVFIPVALIDKVYGFIPDLLIFIGLTLLYYFTYDFWPMNLPIFALLIFGHVTHAAGLLGWYYRSPFPIQYDHLTHVFGNLPFALLFFQFLKKRLDTRLFTLNNLLILATIFFAALGVGALVELTEFWGYLSFGFGTGAFMFGAGDGVAGKTGSDLIETLGGGWVNEGWDMTFNVIGILMGMAAMLIVHFGLNRKKPVFLDVKYR